MGWAWWVIALLAVVVVFLFFAWHRERARNDEERYEHRGTRGNLGQAEAELVTVGDQLRNCHRIVGELRESLDSYRRFIRHFHADALADQGTLRATYFDGGADVDRFVERALEGVRQIDQAQTDAELIRLVNRLKTK